MKMILFPDFSLKSFIIQILFLYSYLGSGRFHTMAHRFMAVNARNKTRLHETARSYKLFIHQFYGYQTHDVI